MKSLLALSAVALALVSCDTPPAPPAACRCLLPAPPLKLETRNSKPETQPEPSDGVLKHAVLDAAEENRRGALTHLEWLQLTAPELIDHITPKLDKF